MQDIIHTSHPAEAVARLITENYDRVFVLTDSNTRRLCLPLLSEQPWQEISIPAGDDHKTIETLSVVWTTLQQGQATRHSLLVNLGGGMVTDLGGFAAATFKRGISFINIPTTLLAMVDAAAGGKTGVNFNELKNEIGAFRNANAVVVSTAFLHTLDPQNLLSGYAEMLKHALLKDTALWARHLAYDFCADSDFVQLRDLIRESIAVKAAVVAADPTERGLRKTLNLGHTIGHALETLALRQGRPQLHGYCVAWGLVAELFLSLAVGLPADRLRKTASFIRQSYGDCPISCRDYDALLELMLHDKKNSGGAVSFTLLQDVGKPVIDQHATRDAVCEALDFLREGG